MVTYLEIQPYLSEFDGFHMWFVFHACQREGDMGSLAYGNIPLCFIKGNA